MAVYPRGPSIKIYINGELDLWLVNEADTDAEVEAGELLGFNVGNFKEIALGAMAACKVVQLRHVASCCHVLSHVVPCCHMLSHVVTCCPMLSHVVRYCHMLSNVVKCCHMLSYVVMSSNDLLFNIKLVDNTTVQTMHLYLACCHRWFTEYILTLGRVVKVISC